MVVLEPEIVVLHLIYFKSQDALSRQLVPAPILSCSLNGISLTTSAVWETQNIEPRCHPVIEAKPSRVRK